METYGVDEFVLGDKKSANKIIFSSVDEMERACKDIDEGKDIYLLGKDNNIIKILHQMVSSKIYDGQIIIGAKKERGKK